MVECSVLEMLLPLVSSCLGRVDVAARNFNTTSQDGYIQHYFIQSLYASDATPRAPARRCSDGTRSAVISVHRHTSESTAGATQRRQAAMRRRGERSPVGCRMVPHAAVGAIHALSAFGRRCRRQLLLLLLLPAGAGAVLATAVPRAPAAVEAELQRARRPRAAPVRVHARHRHGSHFYAPTRPMARRPRGERKHALDTVARRRCRAQVASKT